jgi:urea transport system ATP-binding protein
MRTMLQIESLHKTFGGLAVTNGLDLHVKTGELRCIIGPNGAGKTTLFNLITGKDKPNSGRILMHGGNVAGRRVYQIARMGVSRKFQSPSVFENLTVRENLLVAVTGRNTILDLLRSRRGAFVDTIDDTLERLDLTEAASRRARNLSHGQKQWLEIGMVLLTEPDVVLLDEPTAGMTLAETAKTATLIHSLLKGKTTIVIEHDIAFIRQLAARITVLYRGKVMCEGYFDEIAADPEVRRIYLGEDL